MLSFGSLGLIGIVAAVVVVVLVAALVVAVTFRRVVSTNMVHIVQSRRKTTPYGTKQSAGNVYYNWPASLPYIGVTVIKLPVSNFDLSLQDYEAYDKDRVPFKVDVTAFFRIIDTAKAAQRVSSMEELQEQLHLIVQGAVRKVLASDVVDSIMVERSKFGDDFTSEVKDQLGEWGVESVKAMELMDIRDGHDSHAISDIMAKKTSHIQMESRTEVAQNKKQAETAEIEAERAIEISRQEAEQQVGERTAKKNQAVGIADEKARQEILDQEKETAERNMAVQKVNEVRQAEITKEKQVVAANQEKETEIIRAEGLKQKTVTVAEGELSAKQKEAEAIRAVGEAEGAAEKAMKLAPVQAQIELAKEIGENQGYQKYLLGLEQMKAIIEVGVEQAKALATADIKVITNSGDPITGISSAMDIFTAGGGQSVASLLEGLGQTPTGKRLLNKVLGDDPVAPKAEEEEGPISELPEHPAGEPAEEAEDEK